MILVDPRQGSRELFPHLKLLRLPVAKRRLQYADFEFEGNGPKGKCLVGIERKRLLDALATIQSGRLTGHQLPGMSARHDFVFLAVEGIFRPNPDTGVLEESTHGVWRPVRLRTRGFMFCELDNWLTTISMTRTRIRFASTIRETAWLIHDLYWWFQKGWQDHKSLKVIYQMPPSPMSTESPSLLRQMAALLPGIGWEKSARVEQRFDSVVEMCLASPAEWQEIPGVGTVISGRAVAALNER